MLMAGDLTFYSFILICLAALILGTTFLIDEEYDYAISDQLFKTIFTITITTIAIGVLNIIVICYLRNANPSAEDVLNGDAIIKYEIVDGVKVDSCYVYKRKYINE